MEPRWERPIRTRALLLVAAAVGLGAALAGSSRMAGPGGSDVLLLFGALVALALTRAPRARG
jgi:hypothetical protein